MTSEKPRATDQHWFRSVGKFLHGQFDNTQLEYHMDFPLAGLFQAAQSTMRGFQPYHLHYNTIMMDQEVIPTSALLRCLSLPSKINRNIASLLYAIRKELTRQNKRLG